MSQYFPYRGFKWLNQKEIDRLDVNSISKNNSHRCIYEVDLEYPNELHELHNNYPLAPEKPEISRDMLSKYRSNIATKYRIKVGDINKLVSNLGNKGRYVLHYRNLQLYTSLRMKLVSVHRVLKFKQPSWFKKYIDFNTDKRKNAFNSFEKYFFKKMNNSVYNKTMENLRKRIKVRLVNNT